MSGWWVLALAVVALGACVDQLVRTRRFMALLRQVTAAGERLVTDPASARPDLAALMAHGEALNVADRRAMRVWGIAGVLVLAAAAATS